MTYLLSLLKHETYNMMRSRLVSQTWGPVCLEADVVLSLVAHWLNECVVAEMPDNYNGTQISSGCSKVLQVEESSRQEMQS